MAYYKSASRSSGVIDGFCLVRRMRQCRSCHVVLLILCARLPPVVGKSCLSLRGGIKPGCSSKCNANRARQHCRACVCAACAFCEAAFVASNHSSNAAGLPTTPPARSTSLVLRTIGYIPAEELPLEFGGTTSDFTATGSNQKALLSTEMATARRSQPQLGGQRESAANSVSSQVAKASSARKVKLRIKKSRKANSRRKEAKAFAPQYRSGSRTTRQKASTT